MASVTLAYGQRANLSDAIDAGVIPISSIIITPAGELFYYNSNEDLIHIQDKNKFDSEAEALAYIQSYSCDGNIISVKGEDGGYAAYLVSQGDLYSVGSATTPTNAITEATTHYDFPNVGLPYHLYIATAENNGRGYIYRWDSTDGKYYIPSDLNEETNQIYGGSVDELL
jgi:hypothetical protein